MYGESSLLDFARLKAQMQQQSEKQVLALIQDSLRVGETPGSKNSNAQSFRELGGDSLGAVRLKSAYSPIVGIVLALPARRHAERKLDS